MVEKEYLRTSEEVLKELGSGEDGLSSDEAVRRLNENGKNKLKEAESVSLFMRLLIS